MTAKQALNAMLLLTAMGGAVSGILASRHLGEPALWNVAFEIATGFTMFVWYCRDSDARGYVRSRILSCAVAGFSWLAIPYYLARSRPAGQKRVALLRFGGFVVLVLLAAGIGAGFGTVLGFTLG